MFEIPELCFIHLFVGVLTLIMSKQWKWSFTSISWLVVEASENLGSMVMLVSKEWKELWKLQNLKLFAWCDHLVCVGVFLHWLCRTIQVDFDNFGALADYNQEKSYLFKLLSSENVKWSWVKSISSRILHIKHSTFR